MTVSFDSQVAIVTGAGGGLGAAYSKLLASKGCKILVNDFSKPNADKVVNEIKKSGGEAIANYDSVENGEKIVEQAMKVWGRVDILINNAGILRDKSFKAMSSEEWDQVHRIHVYGSFACSKAVWPVMRKQKYGRIVNTASAAGLYGNFGQTNYSAAKMALYGFTRTLAREGEKYNIFCNVVAPVAASQMTATILPPEALENLRPEIVAPFVGWLVSKESGLNGEVIETGAGWVGLLRWERTKGVVFKTDDTFTPGTVKHRWNEIVDFTNPDHPRNITDAPHLEFLQKSHEIPSNPKTASLSYAGQTAIVTGAGGGLGRAYALMFGKGGANVVVNDLNEKAGKIVVEEITKAGGKAVWSGDSVTEGEKVVKTALEAFGGVHILVNNAGILIDKSFAALTPAEFDKVYKIHLYGTYSCCKAVWGIFQKQKFGRIVNTASAVGVFGNFGQANYSAAKSGIVGLTKALAVEGKKYGIRANVIVPNAGTAMTATIWPEEMVKAFSPAFVAPVVGYLCHQDSDNNGGIYEASGGWIASLRWERTNGYAFPVNKHVTIEDVGKAWPVISDFSSNSQHPETAGESVGLAMANFTNVSGSSSSQDFSDPEDSELVVKAKAEASSKDEYEYTEKDVILYNVGIGATEKDLKWTFEGDGDFEVLPTFGVIPQFKNSSGLPLDWLPNFSPMMLLHGEQYLSIKKFPIPTTGTFVNTSRLMEALDKGKAAAVTSYTETVDKATGEVIFENQSTVFIRGSGGFGGKKNGKDRGPATALNKPPNRKPDAIVEEKTDKKQAAVYRLSGDYNPLHIDPSFAQVGGFDQPILHGLCFFGISGKHIYQTFGPFKDIKVRFVGHVFPGETIVTEMWKEGDKVIFVSRTKERGKEVLGNAAATLF